MSLYFELPLISLIALSVFMTLIWGVGRIIKNNSIVDVVWAFNFLLIASIVFLKADGFETRKLIVCGLAALWSIRLGIYLGIRVGGHIKKEEGRYKQLREEWADQLHFKFFVFFQMQGISNVFLCIPFFIISLNTHPALHWLEWIGAILWFVAILGEAISDFQLAQFKRNPDNKGQVCQVGLWNYSRHPNYFFQVMIWSSVFVFALASPYGWISIVCPLAIAYLIFNVTGIPMTEEQALRSKGEAYAAYQKSTSVFVPWFKKV